ncbi:hypothetical protein [Staphylococcus aureus]|uniref:3-dehydroquinate synthase family protein n=1 Tax=Staphylococcus aureus TaxID=1280 RepID=UPI001F46A8B3|nr:hypothetical protein [Staphylococcus aureus]
MVVADEKEQGVRKFLNLGHTFGHAVEYNHKIAHGHAVMIGIIYQFHYYIEFHLESHYLAFQLL